MVRYASRQRSPHMGPTGNVVLSNAPIVVPHRKHGHAGVLCRGDGGRPWPARVRIGDGIGPEVAKDLRQSEGIGMHDRQRLHGHLDLPLGDLVRQHAQRVVDEGLSDDRLDVELLSAEVGELEDSGEPSEVHVSVVWTTLAFYKLLYIER